MTPNFTRADLKAAIPDRCFRPQTGRSLAYVIFDVALLVLAYWALSQVSVWYLQVPLVLFIGVMLMALFVIGHEAGHGAISKSRMVNTVVGLLVHSPLLIPYRGWQRSHALHHMKTGHLQQEEVYRAPRAEEDRFLRKLMFRSGLFVPIGWPMFKLGFRNIGTYDPVKGSLYLPTSNLYADHVKMTWYVSLAAIAVCLGIYITLGVMFGWGFALLYIIAPYFVYASLATFVTYMQHVSPEVPVYDAADWDGMKGAMATVDRSYGPFDWLTHHIGDQHVIHHIFPTIPHYRAKEAMEAVRPILGDWYMKSDRFVLAEFVRSLIGCHYVTPGDGKEVWTSAYGWAANSEKKMVPVTTGAETVVPAE